MGSKICMNEGCRSKSSTVWKKGWILKSSGSATLCYNCGSAYEKFIFCETFHMEDTGWRDCRLCGKRIHCGCIASKHYHELLDYGGVACISCLKHLDSNSRKSSEMSSFETPKGTSIEGVPPPPPMAVCDKPAFLSVPSKNMDFKETGAAMSGYEVQREFNMRFPTLLQHSFGSSMFVKPVDQSRHNKEVVKDVYEPLPSLNFFTEIPLNNTSDEVVVESTDQLNKVPSIQNGPKARQILPKPTTKVGSTLNSEGNNDISTQTRVARPPADGKGRSQLLPRYWPRITDEELQQLSGDLKSTVVPLFEKILSASDAGRIGRLVLPKACAELYFPTINQSDGVPIRMQDVTGKEWTFQFRFWPNNNSRMYVLEGVTPCIQNLQLEAGDTVTFSRIDPGGQLVIGFRKATNNADSEEPQASLLVNGVYSGETPFSGANENMIQNGYKNIEDSLQNTVNPEKKKARHIGSKNKRLRMHKDDAMELRLTWEEAQDLLRPPPTAKPTIVKIEDYEFEEYEEPPIFGKRSVFTANLAGDQTQWAQCDSCKKWRKVPVDVLLPARWTCIDNIWDANRCSCLAPDEMIPWGLDPFNKETKSYKKRRFTEENVPAVVCEPSGLDALATAAFLGDNLTGMVADPTSGGTTTTTTTTTKHPRHRAGCTCIVCIQPPSGKGKHSSACKCSACNSMKRRFRTLMLKKKRKQSERRGEVIFSQERVHTSTTAEVEAMVELTNLAEASRNFNGGDDVIMDIPESSKGKLDLNCQPSREDDMLAEATAGLNMATIISAASLPLDMYLKQNGLDKITNSLLSNDAENVLYEADDAKKDE